MKTIVYLTLALGMIFAGSASAMADTQHQYGQSHNRYGATHNNYKSIGYKTSSSHNNYKGAAPGSQTANDSAYLNSNQAMQTSAPY